MLKKYHYIIFLISFSCLTLCLADCTASSAGSDKVIVRSFYHWKSDFSIDEPQQKFLNELEVEEIYLRLFDVVWDGEKDIPTAETVIDKIPEQNLIPVVYLTTDVFGNLDSIEVADLAFVVAMKIKSQMKDVEFKQVQFDCDWMPSIKDKYFYFLDEMNSNFKHKKLSATIRLYQYKYPDLAGVPPVDKGLLMYYNMGDLTSYEENNSILNNQLGKQYLGFGEYPLPIDIALPNFEWCAVFRATEFVRLTTEFEEDELKSGSLFGKMKEDQYVFQKDTVIGDFYYRYGDVIRYESCKKAELVSASEELVKEINQDTTRIIFYDLRNNTKDDYEKLDAVYTLFE